MNRDAALALLRASMKNENLFKHSLASEAVMRALAKHLGQNENDWALAGLLHDIDVEATGGNMETHGLKAREMLAPAGVSDEIITAIEAHNEGSSKRKRTTVFEKALAAGETMTGLITATALVYPDKKLTSVKVESITKRMKETRFAATVNRETIMECEEIGIPIKEFAQISLDAMRGISSELGL